LKTIWPELRARLGGHLMGREEMADLLRAAGAPVGAAEIGVSAAHLKATVRASRFIRARYTLPDLLDDTGLLDPAIAAAVGRPTIVAA
jgi:glycerol-1-phosphate dehydrogenase [NAD(P)+]